MSPLDEPHGIFFLSHVFSPLFLVYETGSPLLALFFVGLWELYEYIYHLVSEDYGALYLWESGIETAWNVWGLDVGGGLAGVLLAMSLQYLSGEFDVRRTFLPTPQGKWWVRFWRYVIAGALISVLSAIGWECIEALPDWCVDGYHAFPWGAPFVLAIFVVYAWWIRLPKLFYVLLVILSAPVFVPVTKGNEPPPASFIQFILAAGLSVFAFAGCLVHRRASPKYDLISSAGVRPAYKIRRIRY